MDENNAAALVATTQAESPAALSVAIPADNFEGSRPTSEEAITDITTAVSAVKTISSIPTTIEPDSSAVAVTAPVAAPTAPMHDLGLPENSTASSPTLQQTIQQQQQQQQQQQIQQQHLVQQQLQQQQQQLAQQQQLVQQQQQQQLVQQQQLIQQQQQQQQQSRSATTAPQAAATHPSSSQQPMYNNNSQPANNLPSCQNCGTQTTPLWRRDEYGAVLCNACGLFLKLHGRPRPISLKTDVIKSRNRVKVARNDGDVKRKQQRIQQQAFPLAPDMNGLDLNAMAQVAARRIDKPDNQNGQRNPLNYTSSVTGFGTLDEAQYQAALGQLPAGSGTSGLNGDSRDTTQAEIATLKTRVNELELINELFRGRLGQLEHDEATARRGQEISGATETALRQQIDEWVKNNTELRTQLAESHRREEILKRRLEETEAELQEALEASGQPRKRPRVADPLLEDHALALAALGTETYVHGNPQEHDHAADANMHGQLSASDLVSQVHQHHTEAARAALMAHMSMPLNNLASVSAEHIDPAIQSIPEHLQQQMEAGLAAQVEAHAQAQAQVHADAQAQAMEHHVDGLPSAMEVSHTEHEDDVAHMNTEMHTHDDSMDQHIDMSMAVDPEPQQAVSTEEHVVSVDIPVVSAQSNKIPPKVEVLAPEQAAEAVEADAEVEVAPELAKVEPASATA